jgi:hypothetical protein
VGMDVKKQATLTYLNVLKDRLFKILPLYEDLESRQSLFKYIQSLLYEFNGLPSHMDQILISSDFSIICLTLESVSDDSLFDDDNHEVVRRELLKCIRLVERIISNVGDAK